MFSIFVAASLKSIGVLAVAWLAAFVLRRRSAAARSLVWAGAAMALLALPFLSASLPRIALPGARVFDAVTFTASALAGDSAPAAASAAAASAQAARSGFDARLAILAVWAAIVLLGFARIALGWLAIRRIRQNAVAFEDRAAVDALARSLGIEHAVDIFWSERGSMPMTAGPLRPAIFLPEEAREWSEDRRNLVLLHELAHVRRGDPALHLIARAALALYWWNPLAWIAWRELLKERERAADDLVLNAGARASDYAGHLLEIARAMRVPALAGSAAIAAARKSQLEGRLMAILDSKVSRKTPRAGVWITAAAAIALVAPIAAVHAQPQQPAARPLDAKSTPAEDLIKVGQAELLAQHFAQAIDDFDRARLADSSLSGRAFMWSAVANDRSGDAEAAESLFKSALAQQSPNSLDYMITERIYAQFLRKHQRADEAKSLEDSADTLQSAVNPTGGALAQDGVYHIGGDVSQPKLLSKTEPRYTEEARMAKLAGGVQLSIVVGTDGKAHQVSVVRPLGLGLDEEAIAAVSTWRFAPAMKDGQPVPAYATVEVHFRLL